MKLTKLIKRFIAAKAEPLRITILSRLDDEEPYGRIERIGMLSNALSNVIFSGVVIYDQSSGTAMDSPVRERAITTAEHLLDLIRRMADAEFEAIQCEVDARDDTAE